MVCSILFLLPTCGLDYKSDAGAPAAILDYEVIWGMGATHAEQQATGSLVLGPEHNQEINFYFI